MFFPFSCAAFFHFVSYQCVCVLCSFQIFLHDYLKKKGFLETAQIFQNEAQVNNGQTLAEFDQEPRGFLYYIWTRFYDSKLQMSGTSSQSQLLSCDFSSDGKIVASGGLGKQPFICYMETGNSFTTSETHLDAILEVRFRSGSPIFATSSADRTVKLWHAKRTRPERELLELAGHNGIVSSLDFHPLREILCSSDTCDAIKVWDLEQCVTINNFTEGGRQVRFQPGSGTFLAVANQNVITIFNTQDLSVFHKFQGHVKEIKSICWDATGNMIASVSEDDVRVLSVFMKESIYEYPSNGKRFQSVIFHPRYPNVLVIGCFQCLELLILENGQTHSSTHASDLSITGLAVAQNETITSASDDSVVKIWR
ncbi:putative transcription factor WD40-like family [Medicago truncatula]|uniref:Putative transcription factor WD40-like family n=1 Tax=Medicago truncatula TaxID=3880 RepID=A0A396IC96_MEDTR|nr:putative transcription factor WD40-like family [Medicago truncatula]